MDGAVATLGTRVEPGVDDVRVAGQPIRLPDRHVYIVLNKPTGYVTTVRDAHAERTVMNLLAGVGRRVFPVGRLDADTAGLLVLTDDGDFAHTLMHPSHQVPKTYRALVRGEMPADAATDLRSGVLLDDGMTAPARVEWVDYDARQNVTVVDITLHEGRNRQVRRMLKAVGFPALALTRIAIGPLALTGLAPGTWRRLRADEVRALAGSGAPEPSLPRRPEPDAVPMPATEPRAPRRRKQTSPGDERPARRTPPDGAHAAPPKGRRMSDAEAHEEARRIAEQIRRGGREESLGDGQRVGRRAQPAPRKKGRGPHGAR